MNIRTAINSIDKQILTLTEHKKKLEIELSRLHEDDKVNDFLQKYNGQLLLKKHTLDEEGLWQVTGEDPNCDMGGYHHEPHLGYFKGKLENVLKHAVHISGFWAWGGGGNIIKLKTN